MKFGVGSESAIKRGGSRLKKKVRIDCVMLQACAESENKAFEVVAQNYEDWKQFFFPLPTHTLEILRWLGSSRGTPCTYIMIFGVFWY